MGRMLNLELGILNIKIHPHKPASYVSLFKDIFEIGDLVKIRGSDWGTPNFINEIVPEKPLNGFIGIFFRFLQIDPHKKWLDLKNRKPIVDEKGDPIPQVSSDKKPNMREVEFAFYPEGHLLFFNSKAITPPLAKKLLDGLFNNDKIRKKYGPVDVEIVSSKDIVARILKIPTLTKLEISISRPNGDVISGRKKDFLNRMEDQGIRKHEETNVSERSEGIKPDDDTIALMELATTNGKVFAVGYAGDERIVESTVPHPQIERSKYDSEEMSLLRAIANFSSQIIGKIVSRG